jgi:hypothetical protein
VTRIRPRKGRRRESNAIGSDGRCWKHKRERIAADGVARLREIDRERRAT